MPKDRSVELTIVVRLDRRLDDDLEALIRDTLEAEGLLEVVELVRIGLTGTIDIPRMWVPTKPGEQPPGGTDPPAFPVPVRPAWPPRPKTPPPPGWLPSWRKKR